MSTSTADPKEELMAFPWIENRKCKYCGEERPVYSVLGIPRLICGCPGQEQAAREQDEEYRQRMAAMEMDKILTERNERWAKLWHGFGWLGRHRGASVSQRLIGSGRVASIDGENQRQWGKAKAVAAGLIDGKFLICWIYGSYGTGKTALASAIAHDMMWWRKGSVAIKIEVSRLTTLSLSDREHEAKLEALRRCELLVLDDFRLGKSEHADEVVWSLINDRNEADRSILVTAIGSPSDVSAKCTDEGRGKSILSRIMGGINPDAGNRIIHLTGKSWRA